MRPAAPLAIGGRVICQGGGSAPENQSLAPKNVVGYNWHSLQKPDKRMTCEDRQSKQTMRYTCREEAVARYVPDGSKIVRDRPAQILFTHGDDLFVLRLVQVKKECEGCLPM